MSKTYYGYLPLTKSKRVKKTAPKRAPQLCVTCMQSVCDGCLDARKKENIEFKQHRKLDKYVYDNLSIYGNTVIGNRVYKRLGKDTIIQDLIENGFKNVNITKGVNSGAIIVFADLL